MIELFNVICVGIIILLLFKPSLNKIEVISITIITAGIIRQYESFNINYLNFILTIIICSVLGIILRGNNEH